MKVVQAPIKRLQAKGMIRKVLIQLGVDKNDIAAGPFWRTNDLCLEYLYARAAAGYKALLLKLHPDKGGDLEECVKLTNLWRYVKRTFAAHGIPHHPPPKARPPVSATVRRLRDRQHLRREKWLVVPNDLTRAELARFLGCCKETAAKDARARGYAMKRCHIGRPAKYRCVIKPLIKKYVLRSRAFVMRYPKGTVLIENFSDPLE